LPERLLKSGQYIWGERQGLAWWHVPGQHGFQAAPGLAGEPVADGLAMDPEQLGPIPAGRGLSAGQPGQPLEPWLLTTVRFTVSARLEGCCLVGNDREGVAHGLLS
jgi:hypothetical protein